VSCGPDRTSGLLPLPVAPVAQKRSRTETAVTAFFIPELDPLDASTEGAYAAIRQAAKAETGHAPREDRIFKLWFRRGGADIEAEVGKPDPIHGQTVLAILDLGSRRPYLIHCGRAGGPTTQIIVGKPVYAVTEFAS
jgi:hypothetical protein